MRRISDADHGGKIELTLGDAFEVQLAENPTTGYRWQLILPVSPVLEVEGDSFLGSQEANGAGGLHTWRFQTVQKGDAVLQLEKRRSWESAAVGTFEIALAVTPG
jgi:inhibitor of cysteine peptidase